MENIQKQIILGVTYYHGVLNNGDDIYYTEYGYPARDSLNPLEFWQDREWFYAHSSRLAGSSSAYKVDVKKTKRFSGEIVFKRISERDT